MKQASHIHTRNVEAAPANGRARGTLGWINFLLHRAFSFLLFSLPPCLCAVSYGQARDDYPNRPIRLVVPFAPGGSPDIKARVIAEELRKDLGTIVVDNRGGANGIVGYEIVSKTKADGYTLLIATASFVANLSAYQKIPYDPVKDFEPISILTTGVGYVIVVNNAISAKTLKELIALGRRPDARLAYGTPGVGNSLHVAAELFNLRAGTRFLHVPYRSTGPTLPAIEAGELQLLFIPPLTILPFIKEGRVRPLAITGAKRWEGLPDVPTVDEAAIPGYSTDFSWTGMLAPAGTPRERIVLLHRAVAKTLHSQKLTEYLVKNGNVVVASSPSEFRKLIQADIARYSEIWEKAKLPKQ